MWFAETQLSKKLSGDSDLQDVIVIRNGILHDEKFCGIAASIHPAIRQVRFPMRNGAFSDADRRTASQFF
jgi:hypothetical protein